MFDWLTQGADVGASVEPVGWIDEGQIWSWGARMFGRQFRLQSTGRVSQAPPRAFDVLRLAVANPPIKRREFEVYRPLTEPTDWFTDEDRAMLPALYETRLERDPIAHIKLYTPFLRCRWYVIEFDGRDEFFGFFSGLEAEIGYFSVTDLQRVRRYAGTAVERDLNFEPAPLSLLLRGVR